MRRVTSVILLAAALIVGTLGLPVTAQAQHHVSIGIGVGFGYGHPYGYWGPGPWMYGQWGPWGPWGPYGAYGWYGPWGPYGYGYGWGAPYPYYSWYNATGFVSSLKVQATNKAFKDAEVFVDGAPAGTVEDFDGLFQSLHVKPGSREIVLYKEGFRSVRQTVYIQPFDEKKLKFTLEPLRDGETQDPRPTLPPPGAEPDPARGEPPYRRSYRPVEPDPQPEPQQQRPADSRFGTLSLRVQPADAEVLVDGERWAASAEPDRLNLKLTAGRHKVEVRKEGFVTYAEDILIRDQGTITLNVVLTRK
jgi:hypothetical protein